MSRLLWKKNKKNSSTEDVFENEPCVAPVEISVPKTITNKNGIIENAAGYMRLEEEVLEEPFDQDNNVDDDNVKSEEKKKKKSPAEYLKEPGVRKQIKTESY